MSGDVQPRKRKEKRKRKDEEEILQHHGSIGGSDEVIHIHKENKLGGNICAKIVFFGLLAALGAMVGLIIIEHHGSNDVDIKSPSNSPWSVMLEGWIDDSVGHDGHDDEEHGLHEEEDHDDHDHEEHESNYSEDQHEDEGDEVDDVAFVKETYEDLRASYNQITPQESETEINEEDISLKSNEYATSESEPEASESDDDNEEEEPTQPHDPLGQWKSKPGDRGPELLAEEVEVVQTESETEEESDDESTSIPSPEGPRSVDDMYSKSDITNEADWEIKDELDDADRELDDGDFPVKF